MKRNQQVDIIRGIAIILVVLEHAIGLSNNFFARIILSFHMPLFFILSGYLAHDRANAKICAVILKNVKRLLIPQFTLAVISILYDFFIGKLILHTVMLEDLNIFAQFFRWWFLLVMIQVVVAWELFIRIIKKHVLEVECIILCCCVLYALYIVQGVSGPLYIAVTPIAFGYYLLGNIINKKKMYFKYINNLINRGMRSLLIIVSTLFIVVLSQVNVPVLMYENTYGNVMISIITALLGFGVLSNLANMIAENRFLQWCGRNSIIIYVIHFSIVQGIRGILVRLLSIPLEVIGWIVFLISFAIILIMAKICEKYFSIMFGK